VFLDLLVGDRRLVGSPKTWALEWLRRIRALYRLNRRRLVAEKGSAAFREAVGSLRQAVAEMRAQMETELA
jgi:hypothetical protein